MKSIFAITSLLSLVAALPASDLIARVNQLDILIPVNGTLVRPSDPEVHRRAILEKLSSAPIERRSGCDGPLRGPTLLDGNNGAVCTAYCEKSLNNHFQGGPVKISSDVNCDVSTCAEAHADSTTVTYSFTIDIGIDSKQTEGDTIHFGASWSWQNSKTSSNTYTFTPVKGDIGHIVFRPWLTKSCGIATGWGTIQPIDTGPFECGDFIKEDDNACGTIPNTLGNGEADGTYTFCHTDTGEGC